MKNKKIYILLLLILIIVGVFLFQKSFAIDFSNSNTSSLNVVYNKYEDLPKSYVHIKNLGLANAEFSTTNNQFEFFDNTNNRLNSVSSDYVRIFYHGPVNYGTNRTTTTNASLASKNITGSFTLLYKDAADLSDGKTADVKIVVSDLTIACGANSAGKSGNVYVSLFDGTKSTIWTSVISPSTTIVPLDTANSTKSIIGLKMKISMSILNSETGNPIDSKYEQMLFGMNDLDCTDLSLASGKSYTELYNGIYAEGAEFISGFSSPIALGPVSSSNKQMNNLLQLKTLSNGNMKIQGDGSKYEAKKNASTTDSGNDYNTFYSGFIAPVNPRGFSFNWYGSAAWAGAMGTSLYGFPNVSVTASSGSGGTIEKEGVTTYNLNSSTTYDYTPNHGYKVKSLKVNGADVGFSEYGGTYTFSKLYKNPLVEINNDGSVGDPLGDDYTIDVQFEEKEKIRVSYITDKHGSIDKKYEGVIEGDSPLGFVDTPNSGYKLLMIKCNEPVTLSDGTVILENKPMTLEQLKKVIVEEPLTFTIYHKVDNAKSYDCE